ncbi:MAG: hypothetical protein ACKO2G_08325 [Verrucomicrobiales bacterium]
MDDEVVCDEALGFIQVALQTFVAGEVAARNLLLAGSHCNSAWGGPVGGEKGVGDPVQMANSAPRPVIADVPVSGDPAQLAEATRPPEIAAPKEPGDSVVLANAIKPPIIAALGTASAPDLFTISRLFLWNKPPGQYMNQLLKDIDAAKARGDAASYNELTKRYTAWAEKYLRTEAGAAQD